MADGKKKDPGAALKKFGFVMLLLLMLMIYGLFIYLYLSDSGLYLGGRVFSKDLLTFLVVVIASGAMIHSASKWKGGSGKPKGFPMVLAAVLMVLSAAGLLSEVISGFSRSKVSSVTEVAEGRTVYLREADTTADSAVSGEVLDVTKIEVYQIRWIFAKRLGTIDETYFSVKCMAEDKYVMEYDPINGTIRITCAYGTYGNDVVSLAPAYDTGTLDYNFKLK